MLVCTMFHIHGASREIAGSGQRHSAFAPRHLLSVVVNGLLLVACGSPEREFSTARGETVANPNRPGDAGGSTADGSTPDEATIDAGAADENNGATDVQTNGEATAGPHATSAADEDITTSTTPESETTQVVLSECTTTSYTDESVGNEYAEFPATRAIYAYGDNVTTACTDDTTTPGTVCVEGNATDAGENYERWGAGVGLQLAGPGDAVTGVVAPWNASELGIVGLRFTVTNLTGRPLRVQIAQTAAEPPIADQELDYPYNAFIWGGSNPRKAAEGVNTLELSHFKLPPWAQDNIEAGIGGPLPSDVVDSSKLLSVMFQASSEPTDITERYSFCLSDVEWLDADGNAVPMPVAY